MPSHNYEAAPGSVYLSSHAVLDNHRSFPGLTGITIIDAIVLSSMPNTAPIICSLCYAKPNIDDDDPAGLYAVFAKAS